MNRPPRPSPGPVPAEAPRPQLFTVEAKNQPPAPRPAPPALTAKTNPGCSVRLTGRTTHFYSEKHGPPGTGSVSQEGEKGLSGGPRPLQNVLERRRAPSLGPGGACLPPSAETGREAPTARGLPLRLLGPPGRRNEPCPRSPPKSDRDLVTIWVPPGGGRTVTWSPPEPAPPLRFPGAAAEAATAPGRRGRPVGKGAQAPGAAETAAGELGS